MPFIVACALFFVFGRGGNERPQGGKRRRKTVKAEGGDASPSRRKEETQVR